MWILPMLSTISSTTGLVPQIVTNYRNQHTGALSIVTQTLNVLGVLVRVFTTSHGNDRLVFFSYCTSAFFNLTVLAQIITTRDATKREMKKKT
mmetsp:Transcript_18504/g.30169  ORF Transcript_18504/g.30169 Transcript_18504/m.30169 type:complete len:93 (-) Transcript_18504:589-867(-)